MQLFQTTSKASIVVTDQVYAYQHFEQLTLEALPIQLVLFKYSTPNYHVLASYASVMLNEQQVPIVCQQVVTRQVAQWKVVKANEY